MAKRNDLEPGASLIFAGRPSVMATRGGTWRPLGNPNKRGVQTTVWQTTCFFKTREAKRKKGSQVYYVRNMFSQDLASNSLEVLPAHSVRVRGHPFLHPKRAQWESCAPYFGVAGRAPVLVKVAFREQLNQGFNISQTMSLWNTPQTNSGLSVQLHYVQ